MLRLILLLLLIVTPLTTVAASRVPWVSKPLVLEEGTVCNSFLFDGGPEKFSHVYLSLSADAPIWVIIYDGQRFIRESSTASQRLEFNFINKHNFNIQICRESFAIIKKINSQKRMIAAGQNIPSEEIIPELSPEKLSQINIVVNSN